MRNVYINNKELEEMASSDDPQKRQLVELVRELAGKQLLEYMRELSERYLESRDAYGMDVALWRALREGPTKITEDEAGELGELFEMAGGWWHTTGVPEPEFLDQREWEAALKEI